MGFPCVCCQRERVELEDDLFAQLKKYQLVSGKERIKLHNGTCHCKANFVRDLIRFNNLSMVVKLATGEQVTVRPVSALFYLTFELESGKLNGKQTQNMAEAC